MSKSNLKPYMISEIGLNHNGDIDEGYKLIKASKEYLDFSTKDLSLFLKDVNEGKI